MTFFLSSPALNLGPASIKLHPDIARVALMGWQLCPTTRSRKGMFNGYIDAATSCIETLERWFHVYPNSNWVVIPQRSGVWALDLDVPSPDHNCNGIAAFSELCAPHGALRPQPHGRSGGGGSLLVFRDEGHSIWTKTGTPAPGIDPRARRAAFTIAPSVHRRGGHYRWRIAPWEIEPPPAPPWLLDAVRPPSTPAFSIQSCLPTENRAQRTLARAADVINRAMPGCRNDTLNRQAFLLGGLVASGFLDEKIVVTTLYSASRHAGLTDAECRSTIRSGFTAGHRRPLQAAR
jgi:hypothetical protein